MSDYSLRGHHLNRWAATYHFPLRHSEPAKFPDFNPYQPLLDNPDATVRITAGGLDILCQQCAKPDNCSAGKTTGLAEFASKLYDAQCAIDWGFLPGREYTAREIISRLEDMDLTEFIVRTVRGIAFQIPSIFLVQIPAAISNIRQKHRIERESGDSTLVSIQE